MKFYTPDNTLLIEVKSIKEHPEGILVDGKIMGSMPMKAILRPDELRLAFKFVTWPLIRKIVEMLAGGRKRRISE